MNTLENQTRLLETITKAHMEFLDLEQPVSVFERFLEEFLSLTNSEYGFIGEILHDDDDAPYLKTYAITNIAWDEASRKFYDEHIADGLEFRNLTTLFGHVMVTEEPVISNDPAHDHRSGSLPDQHPALNAFLGLPVFSGGELIGMVGISNRPGGYNQEVVDFLEPLLLTCGNFIRMIREDMRRQRILKELQDSENRARAVLASTHDAIITIDENAIIDSVNPAIERMFGYTVEELIGKNVNMLMPEPHRGRHDAYVRRYLQTGEPRVIGIGRETIAERKDGSTFPIDLAITKFTVPGRVLFTGIVRDISERKAAQANLENTLAQLEKTNENMLAILNETRMGVLMLSEQGHIRFVSRIAESMLQAGKEELIGKSWGTVCAFSDGQRQDLEMQFRNPSDSRKRVLAKLSQIGNRECWAEIEVHDDPRNVNGKILFFYDMTEVHHLRSRLNTAASRQIIGNSSVMKEMFELLGQVAKGDWSVLIEGETGVGKELIASALHAESSRSDRPFITVNCGGLTESLFASQLFGHHRGSFTGAVTDQEGVFEAANGGTIFLDEIGEVPLGSQAALLRVLQEREIVRIGEVKPRKINVRVIAATNRDLVEEVKAGAFREDILYRIRVARIRVPSLRERREDIPLLVNAFLSEAQLENRKRVDRINPAAMRCLLSYSWPGNVRELKNTIQSATITCRSSEIDVEDLPPEIRMAGEASPRVAPRSVEQSRAERTDDPRQEILDALRQTHANRAKAAALLGMSRATFYRRLQEYGLDPRMIKTHMRQERDI